MPNLETRLLWHFTATFGPPQIVGMTPRGMRVVMPITGGMFEGPRVRGTILPGGADCVLVRPDGAAELDIRVVGQSDDGLVYVTATGLLVATPEQNQRMMQGEQVDPSQYYMRAAYRFETASQKYAWLNRILGTAVYRRTPAGVDGDVYEIL